MYVSFGWLLYFPVLNYTFSDYDDRTHIIENEHVNKGLTWGGIKWAFGINDRIATYLPITWLSHMLDFSLFGDEFGWHHAVNVWLHVLNSLLIFVLWFGFSGHVYMSALLGFIFLIHPIHVESVAWIMGRKDLLSTFFGLTCILFYVYSKRQNELKFYILAVFSLFLSLASKSMFLGMPLLLIAVDICFFRDEGRWSFVWLWKECILKKIPFFILPLSFAAVGMYGAVMLGYDQNIQFSMTQRGVNGLVNMKDYLMDILMPVSLSIFYPLKQHSFSDYMAAFSIFVLIWAFVMSQFRKNPGYLFAWVWFLLCLLPFSGIYQLSFQSRANRYAYAALAGMVMFFLQLNRDIGLNLRYGRFVFWSLTVVWTLWLGFKTTLQVGLWESDLRLWTHAAYVIPENAYAHEVLAHLYVKEKNFPKAEQVMKESIRIEPHKFKTECMLAQIYATQGKLELAEQWFLKSIKHENATPQVFIALARLQVDMGKKEESLESLKMAIPKLVSASLLNEAGNLFESLGDSQMSIRCYETALERSPGMAESSYNLAHMYWDLGKTQDALRCLQEALLKHPAHDELQKALAWMNSEIRKGSSS